MGFLGFLAEKKFYIHLGLTVLVTLVLLFLAFRFLKSYTRYGEAMVLPDFTGLTLEQLHEKRLDRNFDFIITDSIFSNDNPPGSIVKQNPSAGSKVKQGRNVYITVVAMTPAMVSMPDVRDLTVRQAVSYLSNKGIRIRQLTFRADMADNAVLGHYFRGDTLRAGDELLFGSEIDLVVGEAVTVTSPVPVLMGLTEEAAIDLIHMSSFNVGKITYRDEMAPKDGRVYLQSPGWSEEIGRGGPIDVWLRSGSLYDFDSLLRLISADTTINADSIPPSPDDTPIF